MTTDSMIPIIRQMHDAGDDRERARILLACPDALLAKYRDAFEAACRRAGFEAGLSFIAWRRAAWNAVRGPDGLFVKPAFDEVRAAFALFANDGPLSARFRPQAEASTEARAPSPAPPELPPPAGGEQQREANP